MKLRVLALVFAFTVSVSLLSTQEAKAQGDVSLGVSLNSDAFFGFYPFFSGAYNAGGSVDFTFYGILWSGGTGGGVSASGPVTTIPTVGGVAGTGIGTASVTGGWGNWTEFGVGIGIPVGDALYISPQVGLLSGTLLSGSPTATLAEGIVPNLTVQLSTDNLEGELYAGYYLGFVHNENIATNDFLHYWLNFGYKPSSFISFGAHFEHLRFMGGVEPEGVDEREASDVYLSLGPYVQFSGGDFFTRFSTGWNIGDEEETALDSYYKLSVGYSF